MRRVLFATAGLLVLLALAVPGVAGATTYNVSVDANYRPSSTPSYVAINGFFPHTLMIHPGDAVTFTAHGFHSVTFPVTGQDPPDLTAVDPNHTYSGYNDANGVPFWFNGGPSFQVPADRWQRVGGANTTASCGATEPGTKPNIEDGTQYRNSGFPLDGTSAPAPYTLCFPRVGTFAYYCMIHRGRMTHGMKAQIVVVPASQPIPTKTQDATQAHQEMQAAYDTAAAQDSYDPGGSTVSLGHDSGDAALLRPFPLDKTVSVGSTVTFSLSSQSEIHMAAFGPTAVRDANENKFIQFPDGTAALNPMVFLPSDPPPAGPRPPYTGTNHGNGWETSGLLNSETPDPSRPSTLNPPTVDITFATKGDYQFECLVHPGMEGTVHVQ
jgi:plastocyanin